MRVARYAALIALEVCLFDDSMFCVNNDMKVRLVIKISVSSKSKACRAGQEDFRLLLQSQEHRKAEAP